ncbi:MAG TPA: bifunctional UDP-N-acetylglucosamine diphosphorylase/glucosamine-1-phosphate N-acetyltransferase GlmU [Pyrinomonadaceae bacterium]|nr:bifunctional UDP-N-acetylglucosamine diphosphorylase/glucosamine-1-phosphate N-acetyltransferase GlmU [Pyrinomonadaceae bacterium]
MKSDLDILILAAGLGTRMRSDRAKVLHRLDGRPLINHVCETAIALSPRMQYVIVGHQAEDVRAAVLEEIDETAVVFAVQQQQLGTGDAVNAARDALEGQDTTLLVLSGDVPMIRAETLRCLVKAHEEYRGRGAACTVLSVRLTDPMGYGRVVRDENGAFERIVEQKDASDEEAQIDEINSGIYCFATKKLYSALASVRNDNAQGEYYLTDVPGILREQGEEIAIFQCDDPSQVEGVNDRRQLADMEQVIHERTITRLMIESGVTFIDPLSAYISSRAQMGRDTVIHPNVTVEGQSVIGERCVIRAGTRIKESRIGHNVEIRDNCLIRDSEVGDGCTVGPMAHLRGHAVMADGSKVGNFVELKKTVLGKNSKASHLTYLGDATIGENTNIGAGTITCNYDGKNKHPTTIGDDVKIGSDTMLIAPVTVADRAVTGAGSVVTKDIEPDTVVAGVPAKPLKAKTTPDENTEQKGSPEQISSAESLTRVQNFNAREEKFVAAVEKSQS